MSPGNGAGQHRPWLDTRPWLNPDRKHLRARAQQRVRYARYAGKITPQPCEVCGDVTVDAHHDDYSKPFEVRWLCRLHHLRLHAELRRQRKSGEAAA